VVLESNKRKSKTGVLAEPELKRNVKSGLRESITRSANLAGCVSLARAINLRERGVGNVGELGSVADHLVVAALLGSRHGKLIPDVHPVSVMAVNALTTNLYLNLGDELLTREIEPASINSAWWATRRSRVGELLANLRKSYLKSGIICKVSVTGDGACNTTAEVGLAVESLLNRFHGKVSVSAVGYLPESNLGITSKVYVLCAISY
jgi:hypothetical protein